MGAVSYSPSIVTMALSCISSEIKPARYLSQIVSYSYPLHLAPPLGGPRRNVAIPFGMKKTRMVGLAGYPMVRKNFEDMCNRLHTIPACDGRTDRRTDRQTDILPRHSPRYAYASRGKMGVCSTLGARVPGVLCACRPQRRTVNAHD